MGKQIQTRSMSIRALEPEKVDDKFLVLEGTFTTFDETYSLGIDWWTEQERFEKVNKDCFKNANWKNCFARYNHSHEALVLSSYDSGLIEIILDEREAKCIIKMPKTSYSSDVYELVRSGIVNKMSWAFTVRKQSYDSKTRTYEILEIEDVYDISLVPHPANPSTSISARSIANVDEEDNKRYKEQLQLQIDIDLELNSFKK